MKKIFLVIFISITALFCKAQMNLVPNPSFETPDTCTPFGNSPISFAPYWNDPVNSADSFIGCVINSNFQQVPINMFGHQMPHTGSNYAGLGSYTKRFQTNLLHYEYAQTALINKLEKGKKYYLEWYISFADTFCLACNSIGARVTIDSIFGLPYSQLIGEMVVKNQDSLKDKINWKKISGIFIAKGYEKFLTIGNFLSYELADTFSLKNCFYKFNTEGLSYYYIDDVSLYDVTIQTNRDTIICSEQTTNYNLQVNGAFSKYTWSTGDTTLQINVNQSGMYWVKGSIPNIGDFYDTVFVTFAKPPTIAISNDTSIYIGTSTTLIASGNYQNYIWNTGINSPNITVSDSGIYAVEVYDYDNCKTQKSVSVKTIKAPEIPFVLPTIIHLKNEKLIIKNKVGLNIPIDKISIFNTLGQVIFESTNYGNEFPNIPQAKVGVGIYYYSIKFGNETVTSKLLIVE